ncbi:multimerin-2-like [Saccostrea cucullata]|uniref:multimerin-2-like n=1 Tax=Saccostrea cuccullata TaxID=36930 RepID=UPI002ED0B081
MFSFIKLFAFCSLTQSLIGFSLLSGQNNGSLSREFVTDNDSRDTDILRHLLNQESIIRMSLTNTVQTLTSNFQSLMKDMLTLKESMGLKISQLEAKVEHLNTENKQLASELQATKTEERNLSSTVAILQTSLSNISSFLSGKSKEVGFTASVTSSDSTWNSGTLVFPSVMTNKGNGYNLSTGIFTAPTAGIYVFFVNVQSYNTQTIYVDIVLNGSAKVRTMAWSNGNDSYDSGPNMVVLSIQKGDAVWVKRHSGKGYYSNPGAVTTFSGFLL